MKKSALWTLPAVLSFLAIPNLAHATSAWVLTQTIIGSGNSQIGGILSADGKQWLTNNGTLPGGEFFSSTNGTWSLGNNFTLSQYAAGLGDMDANGTQVLVGEPGDSNTVVSQAEVFSNSGGTWSSTQTLKPTNDNSVNSFGESTDLGSGFAAIGAPGNNSLGSGHNGYGAVYIFTDTNNTWSQSQALIASDGYSGDEFGWSTALSGSTLLIGGPGNINTNPGHAYLFTDNSGTWSQTDELTPPDSAVGDFFGGHVALDGATSVITGGSNAYVFNNSSLVDELVNIRAENVAIGNGLIAVTVASGNIGGGQVLLYDESNDAPVDTINIPVCGTSANPCNIGTVYNPKFEGNELLVGDGSYQKSPATSTVEGAVYVYAPANLNLSVTLPSTVQPSNNFQETVTATNNATAASPAFTVNLAVPTNAKLLTVNGATGGTCSIASNGSATCNFNPIAANGVTAKATFGLQATGSAGTLATSSASVGGSSPAITATGSTNIVASSTSGGSSGSSGGGSFALWGLLALAALAALGIRLIRR